MPFRAVTVEGVALLCFPSNDDTFQTVVLRTFARLGDRSPDALREALAGAYPRVAVRARADLASFGPAEGAWYVYRDGRFSPFAEGEPWWTDEANPRLIIGEDGRYLDGNEAALRLLGVSREELLGSRTGDFAAEPFGPIVPWVWELLRRTGELHSTAVLRRRSGEEQPVEFHLTRDGEGPGRHISVMREVPREAVAVEGEALEAAEAVPAPARFGRPVF